jgi:hypothetical protein
VDALVRTVDLHTVVLVEGASDQVAVETLVRRRGHDLEGVAVVAMGGATEIRRYVDELGAEAGLRLTGLCDSGEEGYFRRALEHAGLGVGLDRAAMRRLGFFVCDTDLEDELIRALGDGTVVEVVAAQGELRSWLRFQKQPAQRGRSAHEQLHRFMGTRSGRKAQYAAALVSALDLDRVPPPLDELASYVLSPPARAT